jgi:hypothetical protein
MYVHIYICQSGPEGFDIYWACRASFRTCICFIHIYNIHNINIHISHNSSSLRSLTSIFFIVFLFFWNRFFSASASSCVNSSSLRSPRAALCSTSGVSICTFVLVKQVNWGVAQHPAEQHAQLGPEHPPRDPASGGVGEGQAALEFLDDYLKVQFGPQTTQLALYKSIRFCCHYKSKQDEVLLARVPELRRVLSTLLSSVLSTLLRRVLRSLNTYSLYERICIACSAPPPPLRLLLLRISSSMAPHYFCTSKASKLGVPAPPPEPRAAAPCAAPPPPPHTARLK